MENRGAAGLRRSAIAERIRLREEWSALKEINEESITSSQKNVLTKKQQNSVTKVQSGKKIQERTRTRSKRVPDKENSQVSSQLLVQSDVLRGVVVLVDVGSESRALGLRAALSALGATVVPAWSPLVTHLVWSEGGCRSVRARARALACRVVSPLWVEGCAGGRRLPERLFPAPPRPSDLPSPATLKRMLIRAERENISLANLLSDSPEAAKRLRVSDETASSRDTSREEDKTEDTPGSAVRVNTARRAAPPAGAAPPAAAPPARPEPPTRRRRQLFTNREPGDTSGDDEEEEATPAARARPAVTPRARRGLAAAERLARRLLARTPAAPAAPARARANNALRIVVTGMSSVERRVVTKAIKLLKGVVQSKVDKRTDCVVLGSCSTQCPENLADMFTQMDINREHDISGVCDITKTRCKESADVIPKIESIRRDEDRNIRHVTEDETEDRNVRLKAYGVENPISGDRNLSQHNLTPTNVVNLTPSGAVSPVKPRTVNALLGAVRGCRVLRAAWVVDSLRQNRWIHHVGYEVRHLMKISQKARVERSALGRMKREYAYNIFRGMKVHVTSDAEQREAILQLLTMCGAVLMDKPSKSALTQGRTQIDTQNIALKVMTQNGGLTQHGGIQDGGIQDGADITVGKSKGEICSRWVFDSAAAARMRTTRRYINN